VAPDPRLQFDILILGCGQCPSDIVHRVVDVGVLFAGSEEVTHIREIRVGLEWELHDEGDASANRIAVSVSKS